MPAATASRKGVAPAEEVRDWPYEFVAIPVEQLMIDIYQRPLTSFVDTIVAKYRPALLMPLPVSERPDDQFAVVDGQTRAKALERLEKPLAPCLVYRGMTLQQEAGLFSDLQTQRRAMTSAARFRAEVVAEDPIAVGLNEVLAGRGFSVEPNVVEPRVFRAPAALLYVYHGADAKQSAKEVQDAALVSRMLDVLASAWPDLPTTAKSSVMIKGMGLYLKKHPNINDDKLTRILGKIQPTELAHRADKLREGRGMTGRSPEYLAEAIDAIYR